MKAILVLMLVSLAAASVLAYGGDVMAGVATVALHTSSSDEPVALLMAGSLLIGLAGALRRFAL